MNVRSTIDYSAMFISLDMLMAAVLPQMKLYAEIGRLVRSRPEKGAAVAAAEYLCGAYPNISGFSPRNLRRMREFYRTYENNPEVLAEAMTIGWTQNVVILEAELTLQERAWYIWAVGQFGWSKLELGRKIQEHVHETMTLDRGSDLCYSNSSVGNEEGAEETSGAFLQNLRDAEVQRELQQQRSCKSHLQSLFPPFSGTANRADDAPPPGKSALVPSDRERDDAAEKLNPRPLARGEVLGLCGTIPPFGAKSKKAGTVHPNADIEHRRQDLQFLNSCGDSVHIKKNCQVSRMPPVIVHTQSDGTSQAIGLLSKILAKLLKWTVHTPEIFWSGEDYCDPADVKLEDEPLLGSVHVETPMGKFWIWNRRVILRTM